MDYNFQNFHKADSPHNPNSPINAKSEDVEVSTLLHIVKPSTPKKDLIITSGTNGIQIMTGDSEDPSTWQPAVDGRDFIFGGVVGYEEPKPAPIVEAKSDINYIYVLLAIASVCVLVEVLRRVFRK